jgi:hypothetical protein
MPPKPRGLFRRSIGTRPFGGPGVKADRSAGWDSAGGASVGIPLAADRLSSEWSVLFRTDYLSESCRLNGPAVAWEESRHAFTK